MKRENGPFGAGSLEVGVSGLAARRRMMAVWETGRDSTSPNKNVVENSTEESPPLAQETQCLHDEKPSPKTDVSIGSQTRRWAADGATTRPGTSERRRRLPVVAHLPRLPGPHRAVEPRHLQLPEAVEPDRGVDAVRAADEQEGAGAAGRRDLLQAPDPVDLGRDEPAAGAHRHPLRGQGHAVRGRHALREHAPSARAMYETTEWSLEAPDGTRIDLLDGDDPFKGLAGYAMDEEEREEALETRGFRQQVK
ncbi:hypothetical protein EKO27_g7069 [Xylaria grammica]|uniref:Uncharacterized protein n=1 Tax=Xylaria grammica TaxID=363999 RepID=A0A439D0V7_9PEZI|nr:hypothetical protein EKO27_g7069 [Xylaria grammica]